MAEEQKVAVQAEAQQPAENKTRAPRAKGNFDRKNGKGPRRNGKPGPRREEEQFEQRVVAINRVSKTVKGGRHMRFAALMVIGDGKGNFGFGTGKAGEVPEAIKKALAAAKANMFHIDIVKGGTVSHDVMGKYGASSVYLKPAKVGTGIIAGGPMRAVFETMGIQDIVAKSQGSQNPHNMIRATFAALQAVNSPRIVAAKRGKKVGDIVSRREGTAAEKEVVADTEVKE